MAYSPDWRHILSGSSDRTIRIWDAETGAAVGEPLELHIDHMLTLLIGGMNRVTGPAMCETRFPTPPSKVPPLAAQSMLILMHSQTQTVAYYIGYPRTAVDDCTVCTVYHGRWCSSA